MNDNLKRFCSACLGIAVLMATSTAEGADRAYLGSVATVTGKVELRQQAGGTVAILDPRRDLYRPLYRGDEVRVAEGARLTAYLRFGENFEPRSGGWVAVPEIKPPNDGRGQAMASYQGEQSVAAGRTRGQSGPTRRALLVGINHYQPAAGKAPASSQRNWGDLDGCLNDVEAMEALLVTRFGFFRENIRVLTNELASREGILSGIREHLILPSQKGDAAVFFYAGHGSEATNISSGQPEIEQTLVPSDSWQGVADIRDKEIRRLLNAALDKGALVTAIFDSCHSGSITRGGEVKGRFEPPDPKLITESFDAGPLPSERGALVIAAALSTESAGEAQTPPPTNGAFSRAFSEVLRTCAVNESAGTIFSRAKALMQAGPDPQTPNMETTPERAEASLFGDQPGARARAAIPVLGVTNKNHVELMGGFALGLFERAQLTRVENETSGGGPRRSPRLEVVQCLGPARAIARIKEGALEDIQVGDLFQIHVCVVPDTASLTVNLPAAMKSRADLEQLGPVLERLRESKHLQWIEDPVEQQASHIVEWDGRRWVLAAMKGKSISPLGSRLTVEAVEKALPPGTNRLFVALPPSSDWLSRLELGRKSRNPSIAVETKHDRADYELLGRWRNNGIAYAWVRPAALACEKTGSTLPPRTDWVAANSSAGEETLEGRLEDLALRLGKVKMWLTLPSPEDDSQFAYDFALRRLDDSVLLKSGDTVYKGQRMQCELNRNPKRTAATGRRYVYATLLDSEGRNKLIYASPNKTDGDGMLPQASEVLPAQIKLGGIITNSAPFSIDAYILILSSDRLPNPGVLKLKGVRSNPAPANPEAPNRGGGGTLASEGLQALLEDVAYQTQRGDRAAPADWTIQRFFLDCQEKPR